MKSLVVYMVVTLLLFALASFGFYHLLNEGGTVGIVESLILGGSVVLPIAGYGWYQRRRGAETGEV